MHACVCAKSLRSCPTLCDPMDHSPPGSSVQGILSARILEWVAVPSSRDLPSPEIKAMSLMTPALADGFFISSTTGKPQPSISTFQLRLCFFFYYFLPHFGRVSLGFSGGSDGKESTCKAGDPGSIPGSGRYPGEGNGLLMGYRLWVTMSRARLSD